jgi:hypothetical protein
VKAAVTATVKVVAVKADVVVAAKVDVASAKKVLQPKCAPPAKAVDVVKHAKTAAPMAAWTTPTQTAAQPARVALIAPSAVNAVCPIAQHASLAVKVEKDVKAAGTPAPRARLKAATQPSSPN